MKIYLQSIFNILIIIILITTIGCSVKNIESEKPFFFEGEVVFQIEHEALTAGFEAILDEFTATSMIGVVKEDKYKMIQTTKADGKTTVYYFLRDSKYYYDYEHSDTIKWYPLDEVPGELISVTKNKEDRKKVLGEERESVTIEYKSHDPYIEKSIGTYYFHPGYKLNKDVYSNHKQNFWNLFVEKSGSISVRNEIIADPLYKSIYEAIDIKEREVSDNEFKIDSNKVIIRGESY